MYARRRGKTNARSKAHSIAEGLVQTLDAIRPENLANLVGGVASAVLDLSGAKTFKDDLCLIGIEYRNPDGRA